MRRAVVIALVAAIATAAGVATYRHRADASASVDTSPFYAQRLRDGRNAEHDLGALRGKVVLVNFWATWCAPCVEEIPMFSKVHAEQQGRVAFVGLGIDSPGNVVGFTTRFAPSYPLLAAGASGTELARLLGNPAGGLPFTLLLDGEGRIVQSRLGKVDEATLRSWLAPFAKPNG